MRKCKYCSNYAKCKFNNNQEKANLTHLNYCDKYRGNYELIMAIRKYKAKTRKQTEQLIEKEKEREIWLFEEKICKDDYYYRARKEFFEKQEELDEEDIELENLWNT